MPMLLHENNAILTILTALLSEFTVEGGDLVRQTLTYSLTGNWEVSDSV
jgi:hypothetical protein